MIPAVLYLVSLLIAPQLWITPFVGWPTDFIIFPFLLLSAYYTSRDSDGLRFSTADWFVLGLFAWVVLSALANGIAESSRAYIVMYFKFFLLFKLISAVLPDLDRVRRYVGVLNFLVFLLAIQAIQQKYSVDGLGWAGQSRAWIDPAVLAAGGVGRSRWIGIFDGPGVYCVLFTMCLAFPLQKLGKDYPKGTRLKSLLYLAILLWATYSTGARGGFLGSLAVIGLYVLIRSAISIRALVTIASVASLAYVLAPANLTTIRDTSNSTQHRVEMWAEGLDMVKDAPLFGIGPGLFAKETGSLIAHSSAVQIMGELGLMGLFLWSGMIFTSIMGLVTFARQTDVAVDRSFAFAIVLSLFGYLVSSMFVTLEFETFYILLGVGAAVARQAREPFTLSGWGIALVGAAVIGFVIALQAFVIIYFA